MMKIIKTMLMSLLISSTLLIGGLNAQSSKVLIVYFSWGGNTRTAANMIKNLTQADVFEIKTVEPYPSSYNDTVNQARKEQNDDFLPKLASTGHSTSCRAAQPCWPHRAPASSSSHHSAYRTLPSLEAKELKTDDVAGLYRKVDNVADFIQNDFKDCLKANHKENSEQYVSIAGGLSRWEVTSKKSWIAGKTTIAFVGEFSAGKTSIVNRILSQDDPNVPTLPVSTKATTAIPTYIASTLVGSITRYSFVSPDNKRKNIEGKTFKRVSKDILDQVKGLSSLIKYFVMEYNNPNLNGLSILDTPGFNSNDPEDSQRTIDVINECDALFWVFDVNAGTVNRSSISLIKKYLKKPLYVVINKIDTKVETEVNKVEQLIRKTLRDEGVEVKKFIRFSGKEPLDSIIKPIQSSRTSLDDHDH